jgi:hypothetical protein
MASAKDAKDKKYKVSQILGTINEMEEDVRIGEGEPPRHI